MLMMMEPKPDPFWEDPPPLLGGHSLTHPNPNSTNNANGMLQYDRNLNFATVSMEDTDGEYGFQKKKTVRDPLSHRIIEKRRRDRMNNCLADLARLLPQASLRKGRGRIEKTEIVELAIKHLKHLQTHPCPFGDTCEFNPMVKKQTGSSTTDNDQWSKSNGTAGSDTVKSEAGDDDKFRLGFQDCLSETMHFLIDRKGMFAGDAFCLQLVQHLNIHCQLLMCQNKGKSEMLSIENREFCGKRKTSSPSSHFSKGIEEASMCLSEQKLSSSSPLPVPENLRPMSSDFDDADNNSCSSTPLSVEISDIYSTECGKPGRSSCIKPPLPSIIGSHSGSSSAVLSSSNGRSSDEGSASAMSETSTTHRYKFKNTIKQRFTADLETTSGDGKWVNKHHSRHHRTNKSKPAISAPEEAPRCSTPAEADASPGDKDLSESSAEDWSRMKESLGQAESGSKPMLAAPSPPLPTLSVVNMDTLTEPQDEPGRFSPIRAAPGAEGIPAFALHEKGLFYIPLTLDRSVVAPFMASAELNTPLPPLHPVTISVCFVLGAKDEGPHASTALNLSKFSSELVPSSMGHLPNMSSGCSGPRQDTFIMDRFGGVSGRSFQAPSNGYMPMSGSARDTYNYIPHPHSHSSMPSSGSSTGGGSMSSKSSLASSCVTQQQLGRVNRKRHLISPSSSPLSLGYHSWRDTGLSSQTSSTTGSTDTTTGHRNYNYFECRAEEDSNYHHRSNNGVGALEQNRARSGPGKRQKKGNAK